MRLRDRAALLLSLLVLIHAVPAQQQNLYGIHIFERPLHYDAVSGHSGISEGIPIVQYLLKNDAELTMLKKIKLVLSDRLSHPNSNGHLAARCKRMTSVKRIGVGLIPVHPLNDADILRYSNPVFYFINQGWSFSSIDVVKPHSDVFASVNLIGTNGIDRHPRPLVGFEIVSQVFPLQECDKCIAHSEEDRNNFKERLPPWRLIGTPCVGFLLGWWGWHNLRNNRLRGYWGFVAGLTVWGYSINLIMQWQM